MGEGFSSKLGKIKCENERLRICSEKDCGSSERYILSMVKSLIANLNYLGLFAEENKSIYARKKWQNRSIWVPQ